jgi:hypothetical protein
VERLESEAARQKKVLEREQQAKAALKAERDAALLTTAALQGEMQVPWHVGTRHYGPGFDTRHSDAGDAAGGDGRRARERASRRRGRGRARAEGCAAARAGPAAGGREGAALSLCADMICPDRDSPY